jgi:RNA polymerase subunit RPABC4/transcription elongation factor Spt4
LDYDEKRISHRSGDIALGVDDKILLLPDEKLRIAVKAEILFPDSYVRLGKIAVTDLRLIFIGKSHAQNTLSEGKDTFFQIPHNSIGSAEIIGNRKGCRVFLNGDSLLGPDGLNRFDIKIERTNREHVETIASIINVMATSSKSYGHFESQPIANISLPEYPPPNKGVAFSLTIGKKCPSCGKTIEEGWQACPFCCISLEPKSCPSCKRIMKSEWKMCPFCKTMLSEEKLATQSACGKCGKPVKDNWKKCPYCATQL